MALVHKQHGYSGHGGRGCTKPRPCQHSFRWGTVTSVASVTPPPAALFLLPSPLTLLSDGVL